MAKMGLQFGLEKGQWCKRGNRWMFKIPDIAGDESPGVDALPPEKSARPSLSFKEMSAQHLTEEIFYPAKPDWKPITVSLYDLKRSRHPVYFKWIEELYKVSLGEFYEPNAKKFIKECTLTLYDGCGNNIEQWIYEDCWPQSINFGSLDMSSSPILTCEITIRYARAYLLTGMSLSDLKQGLFGSN